MKLTEEDVSSICTEFVSIGDATYEYADRLRAKGFDAFVPLLEFIESFGQNEDEINLHRQIVVERAKETLARPWPPLYIRPEYKSARPYFKSALLDELRDKRDKENGVPARDLEKRYAFSEAWWRTQIDPCERSCALFEVTDPDGYRKRWTNILKEMEVKLEQCAQRYATSLSVKYSFDLDGRFQLFAGVMERNGRVFGFQHDKLKSRVRCPIFSKPISGQWDICWTIEDGDSFGWTSSDGRFEPWLGVRARKLSGLLKGQQVGEFLQIPYVGIIPGFFNAYRIFRNLRELEAAIMAHLCLYDLMAPKIESGLKVALDRS